MKRSLIFLAVIGLMFSMSALVFGQNNKKTKQNPSSAPAGAEQQQTGQPKQAATKADAEAMKTRDNNVWYNAKVYVELALSYLVNPANGFADDNTFRLLKQYTQQAHAIIICHEAGTNPCNSSGETEQRRSSTMENVKNNLKNAKEELTRYAFSNADKTNALNKLNRALELADTYLAAHAAPPPPEKGKGETSSSSNSTNPPIDESTKTKNGQNPIADGTSNSSTTKTKTSSKTANSNGKSDGFAVFPSSATENKNDKYQTSGEDLENTQRSSKTPNSKSKSSTKKTTPTTNSLGGEDDVGKTQRSSKAANSKNKADGLTEFTAPADVAPKKTVNAKSKSKTTTTTDNLSGEDDVGIKPKNAKKQTNNLGGEDDPEKTQRSTKNTNSTVKNAKTTNWDMTESDLKPKTTTTQRKAKTKAKKTTTTPANTTPKKP